MRKLFLLTSGMALLATPVLAKDVKRVISPEQLFQEAKKQCPERATSPEGWAEIRACIAEAKGRIILVHDPRAASTCGRYSGADRTNCADWVYTRDGDTTWSPQLHQKRERIRERLQQEYRLPPEDPKVLEKGQEHMRIEREMIDRAMRNDSRSNRSTITGPINPSRIEGGGDASRKISRPSFLGPNVKGGVELDGDVHGTTGDLDGIRDAIKDLPR
jgi:hypothetical protein